MIHPVQLYKNIVLSRNIFLEEKGLKKHIVCYSRDQRSTAKQGITEVYLINSSKAEVVPPNFTSVK